MVNFLIGRLVQGVIVVGLVAVVVFAVSRATGDPLALLLPPDATDEERASVARALGLDEPYHMQFIHFVVNASRGDLGKSLVHRRPATELYVERLPATLQLAGLSLFFALMISVPLGVYAPTRRGTLIDRLCGLLAAFGIAAPHFWLGLILIEIFSVQLGILPVAGRQGPLSYVMPVFTLATGLTAGFMRLLRSSMLEVLGSDFVKLARTNGASERRVIWIHCLRNAITPLLSLAGIYFGVLVGGAVVTEAVFAWPGIGRLVFTAIANRDYPVIQTVVMMTALFIVVINLIVDILYALIDPRVRYGA